MSGAQSAASLPVVTPVTGAIGASVAGLDIRAQHSPQVQAHLNRALHEHGVLFVRFEGEIGPDDHKRLAAVFGDLRESPFSANRGEIPLVNVLDSEKLGKRNAQYFHSDSTLFPDPPGAAALRAITLPRVGGDTMWASMYAAYEALSDRMQRFLSGLEAVHSMERVLSARSDLRQSNMLGADQSAVHPVVIADRITGRPALYVNRNFTERFVGLGDQESACLLNLLLDHINTPDFHVRLKWDTGTIAVWEESVTQHRAINDYDERRIMHLVFVGADTPTAYGEIGA
jgi:taurine dioxygenase